MAIFTVKAAQIWVAGVNLSDHLTNVELSVDVANADVTAMSSSSLAWQFNLPTINSWQVTADLNQDEAAGSVGATLWAVLGLITSIEIRPVAGSRSASNPGYVGSAMLKSYPILTGGPADAAKTKVTFLCSGVLNRSTA